MFEPSVDCSMDLFLLPHVGVVVSWEEFSRGPLGCLTLMWGLKSRRLALRLVALSGAIGDLDVQRERLVDIVKRKGRFRLGKKGSGIEVTKIDASILAHLDSPRYFEECNKMILQKRSHQSPLFFAELPNIGADPDLWLECTKALAHGQGPTLFVLQSKEQNLMTVQL